MVFFVYDSSCNICHKDEIYVQHYINDKLVFRFDCGYDYSKNMGLILMNGVKRITYKENVKYNGCFYVYSMDGKIYYEYGINDRKIMRAYHDPKSDYTYLDPRNWFKTNKKDVFCIGYKKKDKKLCEILCEDKKNLHIYIEYYRTESIKYKSVNYNNDLKKFVKYHKNKYIENLLNSDKALEKKFCIKYLYKNKMLLFY